MNVGRSTKIALIKAEKNQLWLAEQLGVSAMRASKVANSESANTRTLQRLADIFGMQASEFIALGEQQ